MAKRSEHRVYGPEQASGLLSEIWCQTDIYGLAAILYEILKGRAPFSDPTRSMCSERSAKILRSIALSTVPSP